MKPYPSAVSAIVNDYLSRLRLHLRALPIPEQDDFVREIESHIYEAYWEDSPDDEVPRILNALRKLGEPSEVVAERLPASLVRSGATQHWPLRVVAGLALALLGLPLGLGGIALLLGIYAASVAAFVSYFVAAAAIGFAGVFTLILGLVRANLPGLWDHLLDERILVLDGSLRYFLEQFDPGSQAFLLLLGGAALILAAAFLFFLGRYIFRGFKSLNLLAFDGLRRLVQTLRSRDTARAWRPHLRHSLRF